MARGAAVSAPVRLEAAVSYFAWFNADKTLTVVQKIAKACDRYREKFGVEPTTVLCNPIDAQTMAQPPLGVTVEARHYIAANTFYVGREP